MLLFYLLLLKNIYFFCSVFFPLFACPDFVGGSNLKNLKKSRFASLSRYDDLHAFLLSKNAETQSTTGFHGHAF